MDRGTIYAFYQEIATARAVLRRLRKQRVYRAVVLQRTDRGHIRAYFDVIGLWLPLLACLLLSLALGEALMIALRWLAPGAGHGLPLLALCAGAGAVIGWRLSAFSIGDTREHKDRVVQGECLVVVYPDRQDAGRILDILRKQTGEDPITFVFYPAARVTSGDADDFSPRDPLSPEHLARKARDLAATHHDVMPSPGGRPLHRRLRASERAIRRVRKHLADVARVDSNILLSAEWLLDNSYVIQGHIEDFRRSLPRRYEAELPVLGRIQESGVKSQGREHDAAPSTRRPLARLNSQLSTLLARCVNWAREGAEWRRARRKARDVVERLTEEVFGIRQAALEQEPVPRVYALANGLIEGTDARLTHDNIEAFLQAYQSDLPLTIGELWAVPLMLRLRLIEQLRALAAQVDRRQRERELADFWANRLLTAARRDPDQLLAFIADVVREVPNPTPHFAEQLISHLYDEEAALASAREWLERRLNLTLAEASAQERAAQTREQVSLGSAITSLRELGRLDYTELFEAVSRIDAILYSDPANTYPYMEFATRDQYRHAIEEITRRSTNPELTEIMTAFKVIELADRYSESEDAVRSHVGYYLVDAGRPFLENALDSAPRPRVRLHRWLQANGPRLYLSALLGLTAAIVATLCIQAVWAQTPLPLLIALGALAVLPASEVAAQVVNYLVTRLMPPRALPKMDYEQGVPQTRRTLVVVPMMLLTPDSIQDEVDRLEIRYLANSDDNLRFALLSDYSDATQPHMPEDAERLDIAMRGIARLNAKYPAARFFLFHRERAWSETEGRWMGWERKRGKLEQLNAYLMERKGEGKGGDAQDGAYPFNSQPSTGRPLADINLPKMTPRVGDADSLRDIRFIITLDADTQLPRDMGRRLVETLAHPLNMPVLAQGKGANHSPSISRGYAILQPRVSTSLPSATASTFSRLFTDPRGTDPYTRAVSDVYQDLIGEGSYHGKGIYDLAAFHATLDGRFPTSHLLSHDLIEGAHARVGLVSDVELFDLYPRDYVVYSSRQHRWVRGDWQISDWLHAQVPAPDGGRTANPLTFFNRWKILDNLRRSLLPLASVLLLALAWLCVSAPRAAASWTWLVAWTFLTPPALQLLGRVTTRWQRDNLAWKELGSTVARALLFLTLLPHQAWLNLDAIARVVYRKRVSKRLMLEWETAHEAHRKSRNRRAQFARNMGLVSVAAGLLAGALWNVNPPVLLLAAPFLLLWAISPFLVAWLNRETRRDTASALDAEDRQMLRQVARQTWRFFDDFVGPQTNHLPPDNYQIDLRTEIAPRTSPTNIGLGLLALLAARDMGYITPDDVFARAQATLATLGELETHEGHLFNWYDITNRRALPPRYVSFVDSGNLLGDLWAMTQGLEALLDAPVLDAADLRGLNDSLALLRAALPPGLPGQQAEAFVDELSRLCANLPALSQPGALESLLRAWRAARQPAAQLLEATRAAQGEGTEEDSGFRIQDSGAAPQDAAPPINYQPSTVTPPIYWAEKIAQQVEAWNTLLDRYFGWVEALDAMPQEASRAIGSDAGHWRQQALDHIPSLRALRDGEIAGLSSLLGALDGLDGNALREESRAWIARMRESAQSAQWLAGEKQGQAEDALDRARALADGMNMKFLYAPDRKSFSIGYNVDDRRLDNFYYDLLASEARLGSFCAVARGDAPVDHWFAMQRPFASAYGQRALLSWSGTMFEYLMPLLLTRHYENSLLDQGCRAAVACQQAYGRRRGLPWGISEAAYSALDARQIYQYRAFGVPGLGLKRGLENDLVVAPYATALSLPLAPAESMKNLRLLARRGLRGEWGFYESIDYTRQSDEAGDAGVIVKTYMAHHQGMSLLAIDNLLNANIMQARFHSDPRVRATESLLYERVPSSPPLARDYATRIARTRVSGTPQTSAPARFPTPDTPTPRTHLLANAEFSVMVTNAGAGVCRWKDMEVTRWRADTTRDNMGTWIYIRDVDSNRFWSATAQPCGGVPRQYGALFTPEKAEFTRRDDDIETRMEIVVAPVDNVEVRRLTFLNHSDRPRVLEVTSYVELALAPHAADRAHPAFSKLFVQTENLPQYNALLASRRPRKSGDPQPWAVHVVAAPAGEEEKKGRREEEKAFETDRARFLGRNGTPARPQAMRGDLSGSVGAVLDPIFSLRRRIVVPAGERVEVKFTTGASDTRDGAASLAAKYCALDAANRAVEMAWTYNQLDLRHQRIQPDEAMRYQQLAAYVMYPSSALRANEERLKRNRLAQPGLWAHGISGDLPIVALTIGDSADIEVARQLIVAHNYWRARGLQCDLVILNEEAAGYDQPLQDQLRRLIAASAQLTGADQPGGVFVRPSRDIPPDDLTLILTVARVVIIAARGSLLQQLGSLNSPRALPPFKGEGEGKGKDSALTLNHHPSTGRPFADNNQEEPSAPLPFMELPYFNGTGGFTPNGREYVIYLGPDTQTPLPWINVMANPSFGTLVSESGMGFTWYGNSQSNRLTPWSNDPVLDPFGEAIYIRDEDLNVVWTPTPRPIREKDAYRIRHGQGYTRWEHNSHAIEQELLTFVPNDENGGSPVRIQRLRLRNAGSRRRRLTITGVVEWTLGVEREDTQMHVVTEWDKSAQTLLARNAYHPDFGARVAFMACDPPPTCWTGDRTEFLGRNGSTAAPAALKRVRLSNRVGAGMDPCGALQTLVELEPGETKEVLFVMGQGADANEARDLAARFRSPANAEQAFDATTAWWDKTLGVIEVDTPELAVNFLLNRWLLYQDISCRVWGRSAFYQSGGAFGFRDQLQDIMALLYAHPDFARQQILRSAARQFVEGDVQHWWHPPSGAGVRTRISDDLLWLPYVTAQYVRVTGDASILDETVPFLDGKPLEPDEHEVFNSPTVSSQTATLLEHCRRTIEKGHTSGPHGLPLIGAGDWNDGLNRVGAEGKGESVWLAWFLVHVLNDFAYLLEQKEAGGRRQEAGAALSGNGTKAAAESNGSAPAHADNGSAPQAAAGQPATAPINGDPPPSTINYQSSTSYRQQARDLAQTIEAQAWDGAWYRRAYFDDGTPMGSAECEEAKIDSLPQSWSVICGLGDPERSKQALQSVEQYLVKEFHGGGEDKKTGRQGDKENTKPEPQVTNHDALTLNSAEGGMVLLFTPAFDKTPHDPGYIKGYVPGVRENGGQYTHGSLWMPIAYAMRGEGEKACRLLRLMNPVEHSRTAEAAARYKVEPYVVVADIYNLAGQEGRGGWTWYTGSAGWMYRAWVENALGLQKRGDTLTLDPSIPAAWDGFTLRYRHGTSLYTIRVDNPHHVEHGVSRVELDGARLEDKTIPLRDDGQKHAVRILLGPDDGQEPEPLASKPENNAATLAVTPPLVEQTPTPPLDAKR